MVYDEVNMPQHMMTANDTGKGWDNGGSARGVDDEDYPGNNTQAYGGRPYMGTDPKGQRAVSGRDAEDLFKVAKANPLRMGDNNSYNNPVYGGRDDTGLQHDFAGDDDPRNSNVDRGGYGTVNASSIRPQDGIAPNPYSKEVVKKMAPVGYSLDVSDIRSAVINTVQRMNDAPNPVDEFSAATVTELESVSREAGATMNINNQSQIAYVGIEQDAGMGVTSPRGKMKRPRGFSSTEVEPRAAELGVGITDKAAPKKVKVESPDPNAQALTLEGT
jgi:hypothetical protein